MPLRKNPQADLRKTYSVVLQIGMIASLLLLIVAFRMNFDRGEGMDIQQTPQETVQMEDIPQTEQIQKPPPPPRPPVPVEVPNDEILDDDDLDLDASLDIDEPLANLPPPPQPDEPEPDPEPEIFVVVEEMPTLIGTLGELQAKMKYPEIARKAGVEGKVFINFVVDEKGNVITPIVSRGIGAGCDQEALRVVKDAKFSPGRQRGKPVKVKMSLPITFKLK